jgi:hypothetical protein
MKWSIFAVNVKEVYGSLKKECFISIIVVIAIVMLSLCWLRMNQKMTAEELKQANQFEKEVKYMTGDRYIQLHRQGTYNVKDWDDCLEMPYELKLMLDEVNRIRGVYNKIEKFKAGRPAS